MARTAAPVSAALALALLVALPGQEPAAVLLGGLLLLAAAAPVIGRCLAALVSSRESCAPPRARAHREPLVAAPAPTHPSTPGRRRSRAPSLKVPVT